MSDGQVSLYGITSEIRAITDVLANTDGEITPEIETAITALNEALMSKTDNVVSWVKSQEDLMEIADKRMNELQEFKSKIYNSLRKFDEYVSNCMDMAQLQKIEGKVVAIKKRKPVKVVNIFDESLIPMEYINIPEPKPTVMKAKIGLALKSGIEVSGAVLEDSKNISISYGLK
jgi:hypothetical protein